MIDWVALPKADGETAFVNPERCRVSVDQRGRVVVASEGDSLVLDRSVRRDVVLAALDGDVRAQALLDPTANSDKPSSRGRVYGIVAGCILAVGITLLLTAFLLVR